MSSLATRAVTVFIGALALAGCVGCGDDNGDDGAGGPSAPGNTNPAVLPGTYSAPLSGRDRGLWLLKIGKRSVQLELPEEERWFATVGIKVTPGKLVLPEDPACPREATVVDGRYKPTPARATYRWAARRKVLELEKIEDNCNPGTGQLDLETRWTEEDPDAVDVAFLTRPPPPTRPSPAGVYTAQLSPGPRSAGFWTLELRAGRATLTGPDDAFEASSAAQVSSDEVVFANDPECPDSANPVPGRYRWGTRASSLAFTKVGNGCGSRPRVVQITGRTWFK